MGYLPAKALVHWWRKITVGWVLFLFAFILVWTIFTSFAIQNVQYTWLMPSNNPDGLRSSRSTFHMTALVSVITVSWLLPIFMLILVSYPSSIKLRIAFTVGMILVWAYFVPILIYWGTLYNKVNQSDNPGNPFNDDRWCLLYQTNAPTYCSNLALPTGASNPLATIQVGDLSINPWMLATFWMLFVYIWWIIFSLLGFWFIFNERIQNWVEARKASLKASAPLLEDVEGGEGEEETAYSAYTDPPNAKVQLSLPTRFQKNARRAKK